MKLNLAAAVKGGVASASVALPGPSAATPAARGALASPAAVDQAALPLYRRLGRRAFRLLRPVALPFLARLQGRVALGVDGSEMAARSAQSLAMQAATLQRLDALSSAMRTQFARVQAQSTGQGEATATTLAQTEDLAEAIEAVARRVTAVEQAAGLAAHYGALLLQSRTIPLGEETLVRSNHGWLLLPAEDLRLLTSMVETGGALEPGTAAVIQAMLEPGDLAVDVGAHVGTLTLAMARAVGAGGRVLAIEPTPRLASLLRRSAVMNGLEDVITVDCCAAGATGGVAALSIEATMGHNSLLPLPKATDAAEVPVKPLDALLAPGMKPALVKLDVEGTELEVWKGMKRIVADTPDLSAVVEFGPSHLERAKIGIVEWMATFTGAGFTPWEIEEGSGTIRPLRSTGLESVFSLNILMLRHGPDRWPRLSLGG